MNKEIDRNWLKIIPQHYKNIFHYRDKESRRVHHTLEFKVTPPVLKLKKITELIILTHWLNVKYILITNQESKREINQTII